MWGGLRALALFLGVQPVFGKLAGRVLEVSGTNEEDGARAVVSSQSDESAPALQKVYFTDAGRATDSLLATVGRGELGVVADHDHRESRRLWTGAAINVTLLVDTAGAVDGVLNVIVNVMRENEGIPRTTVAVSIVDFDEQEDAHVSVCLPGSDANEDGADICDVCSIEVEDTAGNFVESAVVDVEPRDCPCEFEVCGPGNPAPTPAPIHVRTPYPTPYRTPYPPLYSMPHPTPSPGLGFPTPYQTPYSTPYPPLYPTPYPTPYPPLYPTPHPTPYPTYHYYTPEPTPEPSHNYYSPEPTHQYYTPHPTSNGPHVPTPAPTPEPTPEPTPPPVCPPGTDMCDDPHMRGLRGQKIDWSGVDGGWYCLVKDDIIDLHVNIRLTAPLPDEFPHRQLITGVAILSEGHSLVIEAKDAYSTSTDGCPSGISPCLGDGGLRVVVDGTQEDALLSSTRDEFVANGIEISASNLPVECRQFGGDKIWAHIHDEFLLGRRQLSVLNFEDWVLKFDTMAAPDWCHKYIAERGLADVQSNHAVFKIVTRAVTVRLNTGVNYQAAGDKNWDGRILPELDFWQMDIGFDGLFLEHASLSGALGETARPMLDDGGRQVMEGYDALRGTVEDYRVSGALGEDFSLLQKNV